MEELFREKPRSQPDPYDGAGASGSAGRAAPLGGPRLGTESMARMLDAAVLLVHAIGNLTSVAEDVLAEQRDRLRSQQPAPGSTPPEPRARRPEPPSRGEQIDLTY